MGLMTAFQKKKKEDPEHGTDKTFKVVGSMPSSAISKQQAVSKYEKELKDDLAKLKLIKSIKQKETEKAEHLVPKYLPLVDSLRAAESNHFLLGQILVWLFDIKDIPNAMALATYCIEKKVPMPEIFKRDLSTYLCDTILEWSESEFESHRTCEPYFSDVCEFAKDWDIPDQVRAKIFRLKGMIAFKKEDFKQAVIDLEYAMEYGAKVKTLLAEANKKIDDN